MIEYLKTWAALKTDRRAVTALEYALIAAGIIVVGLAGVSGLGGAVAGKFTAVTDMFN